MYGPQTVGRDDRSPMEDPMPIRALSSRRRFLVLAVAACASAALPGPVRAQVGKPETITAGELSVLYNPATPPTSFIQNGQPAGMAIDLIAEAAKRLGLKPVFRAHSDVAGALPAISNGQYDVAALGLMRTPEREAVVDFTGPWYYGWFPLVVDRASGIKGYADLRGRVVGAVKGSIQEKWLQDNQPEIRLMAFPNEVGMITAINAGSVDGILMGSAQLAEAMRRYPQLVDVARTPTPYPNAFPLRKGNTTLRAALDKALADIVADGTYVRIYDKWHAGNPLPEPLYRDYPSLVGQRKPGEVGAK
ncbi:MAG: amino acid ABC transporter substrate-binding protein [Alphaproteobacteria bacterium]|nr:amino acid ABC transporter substrate-binding protein [Alphaproteobacteria bacterium]